MNAGAPERRGFVSLAGGSLAIVVAILVIGWSMAGDGRDGGGDATDQVDHDLAAATDPSPTEGPSRRALDLGWVTECAWQGTDLGHRDEVVSPVQFHLELDPDDLEELYSRPVTSDERLPGVYRLHPDGPRFALPDEAIRFRGRSARWLPKRSFNVRLHEPLPALGSDRLNLNGMYTDPAMVREHLSMEAFRGAGIVAPRTSYVDLYLNGIYEGLYVHVQRVDETLLAEHGKPAEGATLVRDRSRDRTVDVDANDEPLSVFEPAASTATEPEALGEVFDHRGEPDWADLGAFIDWVRAAEPGQAFAAELEGWVDVDELIDFLAIHTLLGDVDAFYDDYWLYRAAGDSRFSVIPWDKDLTFGSHFSSADGGVANVRFSYESPVDGWVTRRNRLFDLVMTTEQLRERHDERVAQLGRDLDRDHYCERLAGLVPGIGDSASVEPGPEAFALHDANTVGASADHDLHVAAILDFVQLRAAYLDARSDPATGPRFAAAVDIGASDVGTSVLFTDASGWTVARLDVLAVDTPGVVEMSVEHVDDEPDVDRRWTVHADGDTRVQGQLSFYYRSDPARGDWTQPAHDRDDTDAFGLSNDPVAMERGLALVDLSAAEPARLPSATNPFANRVAADVEIAGRREYALRNRTGTATGEEAAAAGPR